MILIKKDEKLTTNFEPTDDKDIVSKAYLDKKKNDRWSYLLYWKRLQRV